MANYTKATNFTAKDGLPAGNSSKVVKGAELDTEFTAIAAAVASKSDSNSPTFTGTPLAPTAASGTNNTQIATTAFVTSERSATSTLTNKTISVDDNTISGIAASSFVVSNASGNIDGTASQKAIPSSAVAGISDTQTLTNKTIALGSNTVSGTKAQFNTAVTDTDFSFLNDFTGANQSLSANGFQKLPGGLIIQWGTSSLQTGSGEASLNNTFTIPFTTVYSFVASRSSGGCTIDGDFTTAYNNTSYGAKYRVAGVYTFSWIAIGV